MRRKGRNMNGKMTFQVFSLVAVLLVMTGSHILDPKSNNIDLHKTKTECYQLCDGFYGSPENSGPNQGRDQCYAECDRLYPGQ